MYEVNDSGEIIRNKKKGSSNWPYIVVIGILLMIIYFVYQENISLSDKLYDISRENEYLTKEKNELDKKSTEYQSDLDELNNKNSELANKLTKAKEKLHKYESYYPLIIKNVDFRNGKNSSSYSTYFYYDDVTYIYPRIEFINVSELDEINIFTKWITPDGDIMTISNSKSPNGYTFKRSLKLSNNNYVTLGGFGNNYPSFKRGKYVYQVWYNNRILFEKKFTIY